MTGVFEPFPSFYNLMGRFYNSTDLVQEISFLVNCAHYDWIRCQMQQRIYIPSNTIMLASLVFGKKDRTHQDVDVSFV